MGHWTSARVGGGHWRRVWVTDKQEEDHKRAQERTVKAIEEIMVRAREKIRREQEAESEESISDEDSSHREPVQLGR